MKKEYEAPDVSVVLFQPLETLMTGDSEDLENDFENTQSGEDW